MKKVLSMLMVFFVVLSNLAVFASDSAADTERVLLSVKERIGDTEGYSDFQSSVHDYSGEKRYDFYWSYDKDNDYRSLNINANDDGIILSYSKYDSKASSRQDGAAFKKLTSDEALTKTAALLDALNPMLSGKLIPEKMADVESLRDNYFSFNVKRIENDIDVYGNTGYVRVNESADEILDFHINYTDGIDFPSPNTLIGSETAQKSFAEKLGMTLVYKKYRDGKEEEIRPVYVLRGIDQKFINAETGEVEEILEPSARLYGGSGGFSYEAAADMESTATMNVKQMSPAELTEIENVAGLISVSDLEKSARSMKYINLTSDFKLESSNTYKDYMGEDYFTALNFTFQKEEKYGNINLRFNAKTGALTSFSAYSYSDIKNEASTLAKDISTAKASEIASYFAKDKFNEYRPDEENNMENGRLTYTRYVNDIPAVSDTISMAFDENTGNLIRYSISYTEKDFPSPEGIITKEDASKQLFEYHEYKPTYMPQLSEKGLEKADIYKIVYMLDNEKPSDIDAFSGKLLKYNGEEYTSFAAPAYTDISGHYAENAINSLAAYGIYFVGDALRPDESITQKDFLRLLVTAFFNGGIELKSDGSFDSDSVYSIAKRNGIIRAEEIAPDALVNRETAALLMIRALGIEEYALLDGIYKQPFKDVTENIGAISILSGMKVLTGDENGLFSPKSPISRADSMIVMYRYLSR